MFQSVVPIFGFIHFSYAHIYSLFLRQAALKKELEAVKADFQNETQMVRQNLLLSGSNVVSSGDPVAFYSC